MVLDEVLAAKRGMDAVIEDSIVSWGNRSKVRRYVMADPARLGFTGMVIAGEDSSAMAQDSPGDAVLVKAVPRVVELNETGVTAQGEPTPDVRRIVSDMAAARDRRGQGGDTFQRLSDPLLHAGRHDAIPDHPG